jgi:hypothetical protein
MPKCPGVRDTSKGSKERHPLSRSNEGQSPDEEPLLAGKVNPIQGKLTLQYIVRARPILGEMARFWSLINDGTVAAQEPDGAEIVASMKRAVMNEGKVEWYETCYCSPPLRHERSTVYDQFFTDMEIEPKVEPVRLEGERFWDQLRAWNTEKGSGHEDRIASVPRFVPIRIL